MRARIVGLGLIGGSIGIALRRAVGQVSYTDPHVPLADARAAGAADDDAPDGADITVLATPVDVALDALRQTMGLATSVCSVMTPLRDEAGTRPFVAGHPLAGKATRGLAAASGDLFRDKKWFVDREEQTVARMIADCGARLVIVDAAEHDAAVALTSHIPQILSTALAAYLEDRDVAAFAGTGLSTFLRLAASDASVWLPTIEANRANLDIHIDGLLDVVRRILDGHEDAFAKAASFMKRMDDR